MKLMFMYYYIPSPTTNETVIRYVLLRRYNNLVISFYNEMVILHFFFYLANQFVISIRKPIHSVQPQHLVFGAELTKFSYPVCISQFRYANETAQNM